MKRYHIINEEMTSSKRPILSFTLFLAIFECIFSLFLTIMQLLNSDWTANIWLDCTSGPKKLEHCHWVVFVH